MPNLVSHYLLVRDVCQQAEGKISYLNGHEDELYLGTQGPDILYYSFYSPTGFHPVLGSHNYGDQIHSENGEKIFSLFCERIQNIQNSFRREGFKAFVLGWLAHLILDRETHPMTFFLTGTDGKYLERHASLEAAYASVQCRRRGETELLRHPVRVIPKGDAVPSRIDLDFNPIMEEFFKRKFPKHLIREGIRAFRLLNRFVGSPFSSPVRFGMLRSLHMYPDVSDDCMNDDRKVWKEPDTGFQRNDSFQDLFDRAESLVYQAAVALDRDGFSPETIRPFLDQRCYDGYRVGTERKYFSADRKRIKW